MMIDIIIIIIITHHYKKYNNTFSFLSPGLVRWRSTCLNTQTEQASFAITALHSPFVI